MCCGVFSLSQYHLLCNLFSEEWERRGWELATTTGDVHGDCCVHAENRFTIAVLSRVPVLYPMPACVCWSHWSFQRPIRLYFSFIFPYWRHKSISFVFTIRKLYTYNIFEMPNVGLCVCVYNGLRLWLIAEGRSMFRC